MRISNIIGYILLIFSIILLFIDGINAILQTSMFCTSIIIVVYNKVIYNFVDNLYIYGYLESGECARMHLLTRNVFKKNDNSSSNIGKYCDCRCDCKEEKKFKTFKK